MFCRSCGQRLTPAPVQDPAPEQNAYQQPQYEQPQYEQPQYQEPRYDQGQYQQGGYQQPIYQGPVNPVLESKIKTSLIINIIAGSVNLLMCTCCLLGIIPNIIGIVFSCKAKNMLVAGNEMEAEKNLKTAQILMWVGVGFAGLGLISIIVSLFSGSFGLASLDRIMRYID